jgi:hypothetical protein
MRPCAQASIIAAASGVTWPPSIVTDAIEIANGVEAVLECQALRDTHTADFVQAEKASMIACCG